MINHEKHAELIKKAQFGDKDSLNRLAEAVRVHLHEYVLRLTLQEDLTQDIVQESILEMFKVFDKLKKAERFWAWLDGIAFNKVRSHYGRRWRHKTISLTDMGREITTEGGKDALADIVNRELKQIVLKSMRELAPRHRAVLIMRCYRQMPYSEIAGLMNCTEFGAQSLFYRAKKALAKKLSRHGLGKGYLLPALVLFGKLTATTEATAANISVTAATLKVGAAATLAAVATSKTAVVSLITAGMIAGGTVAVTQGTAKIDNGPNISGAQTFINGINPTGANLNTEQCWYFFPEGAGGPVMMRLLKFDASGENSYCRYLQNQRANYYYNNNTIYINNFHIYSPDLSVVRLPTDGEDLSRFISRVEGKPADMEYVSSKRKGLLVISERSTEDGNKIWRIDRHFNILEEEYFQFDWPQSTRIVDNRDSMHKRGWTYFRITGQINGQKVTGSGRIPFVYAARQRAYPWLELKLGDGSKIVDSPTGTCVFDRSGKPVVSYEGGSLFKGLGRPWMGLHTIDTVRRDAAEKQIWFETKNIPGSKKTAVVLTTEQLKLVYTIDMETDVIEKIVFTTDDGNEGEMEFTYLQDIDDIGDEFAEPRIASYRSLRQEPPGMLWLVKLIDNHW
jgi:RNA polymerase sigma factor (sigma-70 family)